MPSSATVWFEGVAATIVHKKSSFLFLAVSSDPHRDLPRRYGKSHD